MKTERSTQLTSLLKKMNRSKPTQRLFKSRKTKTLTRDTVKNMQRTGALV